MSGARTRLVGLIAAVAAAGVLLGLPQRDPETPAAPAVTRAERAQLPGALPDGPAFSPGVFLDARTAIGTAPTPDGRQLRLIRFDADGKVTELRRRPLVNNLVFDAFSTDGATVAWLEGTEIWAADLPALEPRRLTTDVGNFLGFSSEHDLVIAEQAVHWAAAPPTGADRGTEIRSVPLAGGKVTVRAVAGQWSLSGWPWLVDGAGDRTGATQLRDLTTGRVVDVPGSGAELATCDQAWCRVMVIHSGGVARIDLMRPDGTDRRRVAGPEATAATNDVAILDRFEPLSLPQPDSDLTGTEALAVHDLAEKQTIQLSPAVSGAFSRGGVLWWYTGDVLKAGTWHTLDLRTITD